MKVTHILVIGFKAVEPNPYYSIQNSHIEPEIIETFKHNVIHFYKVEEVKAYIEAHPEILDNKGACFYKVDEIKPTRTVTIDVSL